jgi:hypothetical protein
MNINVSLDDNQDLQNISNILVKLIKKCTVYLSANDDEQLKQKISDLNGLYAMWINDTDEGELFYLLAYFTFSTYISILLKVNL